MILITYLKQILQYNKMDTQFPKRGGPINGRYLRFANKNETVNNHQEKQQEQTKNTDQTQTQDTQITSCIPPAVESSRCTPPMNPDQ